MEVLVRQLDEFDAPLAPLEGVAHALDQSLILEVPQLGRLATYNSEIALRNDPKRTGRRQRSRFGSIQRVDAVAIVHQLAVVTTRQIEIPNQHVSRIDRSTIMPFSRFAIALVAGGDVAATDIVVALLGEPATATSKREALIVSIANAIIALARIDVARIEVAGHGPPPSVPDS